MANTPDAPSSTSIELEQAQIQTTEPSNAQARAEVLREALANRDRHHDLVGLEREIRRRQEIESTLRDSEARYRLLYDNNPSMYFTLSPEGTVVSVNQFGATQLGFQPTELIGQSVLKVFRSEEHQAVLGQLVVCAASPLKVFQWEIQKVRKDGTALWVKERAQAITDEAGQILVLVVCEDITERRLTEDCMRESEERWRALFEHAGVGIAQLGLDGQFLRVNPRLCETLGYSSKTLLQRTFQEFTHPDDLQLNLHFLNELVAGKRPSFSVEKRYRRSDDVWVWVDVTVSLVRNASSVPVYFIAVVQNIDDRKRAEEALQESEMRFRQIAETIEEVVWSADPAIGKTLYISPAYERVWGRTCASLYEEPKSFLDAIHPDDRGRISANLAVQHDGLPFAHEYRVLRPDGVVRWVWDRGFPVRDPETGHLTHYVGVAVDITDRKQAEEALSASEERFSKAFRSSPYPIGITDLETGACVDINDAALTVFGFTREEVLGQSTFTLGIWPEPEARQQFIERVKSAGTVRNVEVPLKSKRGDVRRFLASTEVIVLNGRQCLVTIGTDITEQKRAEEALRRSEQAVRQAFEERERLSQDLHDNLLQSLYAIGMGLELTKQRIQRISHTNAKRLEDSVNQLNSVIREVRSFIPRMQPLMTQDMTLADALRALTESFVSTGAGEITLNIDDDAAIRLSPEQSTHVLAIAKEALSNSIRHTKAAKRTVRLRRQRRTIRLEIADNGGGFSLARRRSHGMGLKNMHARARKLRGRLAIASALNKGTTVTLSIPSF
jgi:PAS domain S-box-containing protein